MRSIELCAGGGGQALGVEQAGFSHEAVVEIDPHCRDTLALNRPSWNIMQGEQADLRAFDGRPWAGIDLLAAGLPCPPFSKAGRQLGADDERDLFPAAMRVIEEARPRAVMIENVRGFLDAKFDGFRASLKNRLAGMGYETSWRVFKASDFGVPQLRPRVAIVAVRGGGFEWPAAGDAVPPTVGAALHDLMAANGWEGAAGWREAADDIAPTIVGGSKKHGGADLGPTRAKRAWAALGVNGKSIADEAPPPGFSGMPRLTTRMVARLQGFPDDWRFAGRKTAAYRQVGNAFPPPVARAVAGAVRAALA